MRSTSPWPPSVPIDLPLAPPKEGGGFRGMETFDLLGNEFPPLGGG
jgi:hypothetical protein